MQTLDDISGVVAGVFAILTVVMTGTSGLFWFNMRLYKDSNSELRERDSDRRLELAEKDTELVAALAEIRKLGYDKKTLESAVRHDEEIKHLISVVEDMLKTLRTHHGDATAHWDREATLLTKVQGYLEGVLNDGN